VRLRVPLGVRFLVAVGEEVGHSARPVTPTMTNERVKER
jgi:hypothetical protein